MGGPGWWALFGVLCACVASASGACRDNRPSAACRNAVELGLYSSTIYTTTRVGAACPYACNAEVRVDAQRMPSDAPNACVAYASGVSSAAPAGTASAFACGGSGSTDTTFSFAYYRSCACEPAQRQPDRLAVRSDGCVITEITACATATSVCTVWCAALADSSGCWLNRTALPPGALCNTSSLAGASAGDATRRRAPAWLWMALLALAAL